MNAPATVANPFAVPALSDPRAAGELDLLAENPDHQVRFDVGPVCDLFLNLLVRRDRP